MEVLLFLAFIAIVIAGLVISYQLKRKRREGLQAFAVANGLSYFHQDPYDLLSCEFQLFSMGDGRGLENVLSGRWKSLALKAADY
jgi:hypothetical protein